MASGYGMVTATNHEQLWFPAHGLYKIKPVNILAWMGEAYDAVSPTEMPVTRRKRVTFFCKCNCCRSLVDDSKPTLTQAVLTGKYMGLRMIS